MSNKYKLELWNKKELYQFKYRTVKVSVLVRRDSKGRLLGKNSVIRKIQEKNYSKGIYRVGIVNKKIIVRQLITKRILNIKIEEIKDVSVQYGQQKITTQKEVQYGKIYRTSYVLNNVPISKNGYFGFRICAFSRNSQLLTDIKAKLKDQLIRFIEDCLKYNKDEFWFDMYFGYESPQATNASNSEVNNYYLTKEDNHGIIVKEKSGSIGEL